MKFFADHKELNPKEILLGFLKVFLCFYCFLSILCVSSLPDDYNCDAVGVVTYVGRYKRERKGGIRNDTWLSRWIHLRDGTSSEPFRVKIYCTSQVCNMIISIPF